jgi:hypothetical protein
VRLPPAPPCISVTHFESGDPEFEARARDALGALTERPGFRRGNLARSTDADDVWVLVTEWDNVGSYRRALGNYDVKVRATTLLADALDVPSSFEALVEAAPGGDMITHASDREPTE